VFYKYPIRRSLTSTTRERPKCAKTCALGVLSRCWSK